MGQGNQDIANAEVQEVRLEVVAEGEDGDGGRHLGLNGNGDIQHKLLALLHSSGFQHQRLVTIRTSGQVSQRRDGMALDFFVVGRAQEVHQGLQEVCLDDRRLVQGVDGDVADAGDGGEDKRKIR